MLRQAWRVSPEPVWVNSMIFAPERSAASRRRRWRTGNSSFRSGAMSTMVEAAAASAIVARGRSRRSRPTPSPRRASRRSIPSASASADHARASSFVPRAPPRIAIELAPLAASAERTRSEVRESADDQSVVASPSAVRMSGSAKRRSECTDSKLNRPRSQSHPQLTASSSTPWKRRMRSRLECTEIRHPTEQEVQVLSTCSRSHGRALKR